MGWRYYIAQTEEYLNEIIPTDPISSIAFLLLTLLGGLFQASLMGLFFLMGGYFTPRSYDRKGVVLYWKERLIRLGIPLVLYIVLVDPILVYSLAVLGVEPWSSYSILQGSFFDFYLSRFQSFDGIIDFLSSTGPMWFLTVLLILTAGYTLWRQILKAETLKKYIKKECAIPNYLKLLLLGVILGIFTFIIRLFFSIGEVTVGVPFAFSIQYAMMFIVGVISFRNDWFQKVTNSQIKQWTITILTLGIFFTLYVIIALVLAGEQTFSDLQRGFTLSSLIFSLVDNIICIAMIFVLIPLFRVRFNTQGNLIRKLSDNAYHMYLVHAPLLVIVSLAFSIVSLPSLVKLIIVYPLAVVFCFLFSHYVLRKIL
ncbi:MAG: acyltransferase family protein [Candidatus Hodarchaeota archaeon]